MATPIGHALAGLTIGRRLGVTSPLGMVVSVVAAGLPDIDVPISLLLHRDPWKLHRRKYQGTHTPGFALMAGMLAGITGLVRAGSLESEGEGGRDVIADALTGTALVGSHLVMDWLPLPYFDLKKARSRRGALGRSAWNWTLDAAVYGTLARAFMPRRGAADLSA